MLEARKEELAWARKQQIYVKVPIKECWQTPSKLPIQLKWVDRNKGDSLKENYRSRLVVREIKKKGQALPDHELHSSMPRLEALKVLCSLFATQKRRPGGGRLKLKLLDISRAYFTVKVGVQSIATFQREIKLPTCVPSW